MRKKSQNWFAFSTDENSETLESSAIYYKEEVVELLEKDKRKYNVVILNLEEDSDNASNVNYESRVRSLVHDVLTAGDIEIVYAVKVTGIQPAM